MSDEYSGTPSADSYYERLGVDRAAGDDEIDTASKLAKRAVHPDNNSSEQATAEREFDRVTDAGDALTDGESRAAYDTFIEDQGPETGTELYEQWDADSRPQPPTEWLAQPRSTETTTTTDSTATTTDSTTTATADSTTTATADSTTTEADTAAHDPDGDQPGWTQPEEGDRRGWSGDEWNTRARTPEGQTDAGEPEGTATGGEDGTATDAATMGSETADNDQRTTVHTGETATATDEETTVPTDDAAAAAQAAGDTASETPPKRSARSVLNRDPEEMYSEFVLDSDPEWGTDSTDDTAERAKRRDSVAGGRGVAAAVPAPLARLLAVIVASPLGGMLTVAAPQSRLLRAVAAAVLVGVGVAAGPVAGAVALLPLVVFPRVGPWLFGTLAAATAALSGVPELAVPASGWLALAACAGGYYLLVRGSRLDPYASA